MDRASNAPKLLDGTVTNFGTEPGNDLDYYAYELNRLRELGRSVTKVWGEPQDLVDAGAAFDDGIPNLRKIRDPLTHPNDDDRLDNVAWLGALMNLDGDGGVTYLIDPRYNHHDVALEYSRVLIEFLRAHVKASIAADPPKPIEQQIADRNANGTSR